MLTVCSTAQPQGRRRVLAAAALIAVCGWAAAPAQAAEPIKIGLVTALSGQSALAGESITRGISAVSYTHLTLPTKA